MTLASVDAGGRRDGGEQPARPGDARAHRRHHRLRAAVLVPRGKVFPVFERVYAERTEAIEGAIAAGAAGARARRRRCCSATRRSSAEARDEAGRIRTEAQSQRAEIVEEARVEARAEAQRILEVGQAQIASERQQALAELRREVGTLAVDLASRVVGESLAGRRPPRGTVDRYLAELEGTAPPAGTAV